MKKKKKKLVKVRLRRTKIFSFTSNENVESESESFVITAGNNSCGKVTFSQVSVSYSVHVSLVSLFVNRAFVNAKVLWGDNLCILQFVALSNSSTFLKWKGIVEKIENLKTLLKMHHSMSTLVLSLVLKFFVFVFSFLCQRESALRRETSIILHICTPCGKFKGFTGETSVYCKVNK